MAGTSANGNNAIFRTSILEQTLGSSKKSAILYVSCVQGLGVTQPCCESQLCHLLVGDLRYGGDFLPSTYSLDLSYTPDLCIPLECLTDSSN